MIRVFVTGGRDFDEQPFLAQTLDQLHLQFEIAEVGHGACHTGADPMAQEWAVENEVDYKGFPAKWKTQGRSAGPRRNKRALKEFQPDKVIAFNGGSGTENCVKLALSMNIPVLDLRDK